MGPKCVPWVSAAFWFRQQTSGPPMLPVMYNSNYQIVQSANTVLIMVEMVHDARIIRLTGGTHPPDQPYASGWATMLAIGKVTRWWWKPPTSRIVTAASDWSICELSQIFHVGSPKKLKVIKHITRTAQRTIEYEFTIEDPDTFSTAWRGEIPFHYTEAAHLRIRLPRRQLRAAWHPCRCPRSGETGTQPGHDARGRRRVSAQAPTSAVAGKQIASVPTRTTAAEAMQMSPSKTCSMRVFMTFS